MKKSLLPSPTSTSSSALLCLESINNNTLPSLNPTSIRWPKRQQSSGRLRMPFRGITALPVPEGADPAYEEEVKEGSRNSNKVQELEILEEEAIAGRDQGRSPTDYDRRARIFSESNRVFQELKDKDADNYQLDGD